MNPKVSIILPTYNRSGCLERAIKSVQDQSFTDWELIIIDDASTDETPVILKKWGECDRRIRIFRNNENVFNRFGIAKSLNRGLEMSRGKYVARLDDDDYWCDSEKIKIQTEFLDKHHDYVLCGGGVIVIDEKENEIFRYFKSEEDKKIRERALFANPFSHTTTLFLREAAIEVGGYDDLRYAEDWDLWLRLGGIGKFYNFPRYFTKYSMSENGGSFIYQQSQSKMILGIIIKHRLSYPNFYLAYLINFIQFCYSFLPISLRKTLHPLFSKTKRSLS